MIASGQWKANKVPKEAKRRNKEIALITQDAQNESLLPRFSAHLSKNHVFKALMSFHKFITFMSLI